MADLQWRAGQLPGRTVSRVLTRGVHIRTGGPETLQWRAGQLPGRTRLDGAFNGGAAGNCPD